MERGPPADGPVAPRDGEALERNQRLPIARGAGDAHGAPAGAAADDWNEKHSSTLHGMVGPHVNTGEYLNT